MLSGEGLIAVVGNPRPRLKRDGKGRFLKRGHGGGRRRGRKARSNPTHRKHRSSSRARSRRRASSGHHYTRRRARRNPRFALPSMGGVSHTLTGAAIGASGALALDLALSFGAPYLPAMVAVPGWPRNALRLAGAFLIGALSGFVVKPETRRAITAGAVVVVSYDIFKQLANQYVLPMTNQLGGEDQSYPYAYNPYLTGLAHGGSGGAGEQGMGGLRGYIRGPGRVRSSTMPRVRPMSSYVDDGVTSAGGSSMGADIEL